METINCSKCWEPRQPYSVFDRQGFYCRTCRNAYRRANRPPLTEAESERDTVRKMAQHALRQGKITREPCMVCDDLASEMHHPDYSKPLEVVWFCAAHHRELTQLELRIKRRKAKPNWPEQTEKHQKVGS